MANDVILKSYDEFKSELRDRLLNELEKRTGMTLSCKRHEVDKINEKYESFTIGPENSRIGVNARIDKAFRMFREGVPIDEVVGKVADVVEKALYNIPDVNTIVPAIENYDRVKDRLVIEIVSADNNREMLGNIPHKDIEDMALIYRIDMGDSMDGHATFAAGKLYNLIQMSANLTFVVAIIYNREYTCSTRRTRL